MKDRNINEGRYGMEEGKEEKFMASLRRLFGLLRSPCLYRERITFLLFFFLLYRQAIFKKI
ncbi:MAG: hypothetical protein U9O96_00160 [Candidatus Thermoplasmatota archaeon]|nr:hypothetical protein [Candidatus Thermoplasmatota archaeon]